MTQDDINSGFSGRLSSIETTLADIYQQLVTRPNITTYSQLSSTFRQDIATIGQTNDNLEARYSSLENAFVSAQLLGNQRFTILTGQVYSLSGSVDSLNTLVVIINGSISTVSSSLNTHALSSPRYGHGPSTVVLSTANYTISSTDDFIMFSGSAPVTGTLPSASGSNRGLIGIKNLGSSTVTLTGSQLINNSGSYNLLDTALLISNGTGWFSFN